MDNALSDDDGFSSINLADQLSRIDTAPPQDIPPREGLYSTPLSWERPQPGIRMDSLIGLHSPALNEAEQRRLIAIAMNPGPSMGGLGSNINLNFSGLPQGMPMTFGAGGLGSTGPSQGGPKPVSPPHPGSAQGHYPPHMPKKQGSFSMSMSDKGKDKLKTGDRTAHNDIERKYRTNLKDKISELRDAVPSLRTISENGGEDETQPSRSAKVSKVGKSYSLKIGVTTNSSPGYRAHQGNGVHTLPRAQKQTDRAGAPRALPKTAGVRAAAQRDGADTVHDADVQQDAL